MPLYSTLIRIGNPIKADNIIMKINIPLKAKLLELKKKNEIYIYCCKKGEIIIILYYKNLTSKFLNGDMIKINKRFQCKILFRIFPICAINFPKATSTNFLNIFKMFILVIFNMFLSNGFFNPINPLI